MPPLSERQKGVATGAGMSLVSVIDDLLEGVGSSRIRNAATAMNRA
jgi:hypothetical protein